MSERPAAAKLDDGINAYLTGGLGNQLFIYAAALEQSRRLGCKLYVDASHYLVPDRRLYELGAFEVSGELIVEESPWAGLLPNTKNSVRHRLKNFLSSVGRQFPPVYQEKDIDYSNDIETVQCGSTLSGYFQSWRYFDGVASEIRNMMLDAPLSPSGKRLENRLQEAHHTVLHVRRGDYLSSGAVNFHGLTGKTYFERGLDLLESMSSKFSPVIFTDDEDLISREIGLPLGIEVISCDGANPFDVLRAMSCCESMIMSNSSFSWWAAWLRERPGRAVVAPRPWFADGRAASDLLLPNWITLDARQDVWNRAALARSVR